MKGSSVNGQAGLLDGLREGRMRVTHARHVFTRRPELHGHDGLGDHVGSPGPDHVHALWTYPEGFMVSYSTNFGNGSGNSFKIFGDAGVMDMVQWTAPVITAEGGPKRRGEINWRQEMPVAYSGSVLVYNADGAWKPLTSRVSSPRMVLVKQEKLI